MSIWFKNYNLDDFNAIHRYMVKHLGIEIIEIGDNYIKGTMPVDERTKMPLGLLHGGASCVLAETLGSYASGLCIDPEKQKAVGLEINANHIKSVTSGIVTGIATPIHLGKSTHVWDIRIHDEQNNLVCVSRLTVKVL
ncbi:MAG: hotdog fold thioesterase [Gammaproteobacteria bacterium]